MHQANKVFPLKLIQGQEYNNFHKMFECEVMILIVPPRTKMNSQIMLG